MIKVFGHLPVAMQVGNNLEVGGRIQLAYQIAAEFCLIVVEHCRPDIVHIQAQSVAEKK